MTNEIAHKTSRWGLPDVMMRQLRKFRKRTVQAPFAADSPDTCWLGKEYWHNHPVSNFDYQFNGWACRDHRDYDQYLKENTDQKVNLCIGDSFTINVGGPIEHSWPALLEQLTGIPSINLAYNSMSSYYFQDSINKIKSLVNVDNIFVLYNSLDDSVPAGADIGDHYDSDIRMFEQKLTFLKKHCWIHGAYWQFIPPSCFSAQKRQKLYEHFPAAHDFIKNVKFNLHNVDIVLLMSVPMLKQKYQQYAGPAWPAYEKFCQLALRHQDVSRLFSNSVDAGLVQEFMRDYFLPAAKAIAWANRDGLHMNKYTNQLLADYFYHQSRTIKPADLKI